MPKKIGFQAKDRAIILGENSIEWMICYFAVLYAGGVVVPVDTELLPDDTCSLMTRMDPTFIFYSANQVKKVNPINKIPILMVELTHIEKMLDQFASIPSIIRNNDLTNNEYDSSIATIVNSSGTGGKMK
jgi:long-chain acyl-CoA synthetase